MRPPAPTRPRSRALHRLASALPLLFAGVALHSPLVAEQRTADKTTAAEAVLRTATGTQAGKVPATEAAIASGGSLVEINGTELWVERIGSGEPIVVVHGGPLLDHGYLEGPLAPLARHRELIFYDQRLSGRSHGGSDDEPVTLADFVADIEALRRALDLGPIHLLAHSWGARLALEYAVAHRAPLRSLLLLDPMAASADLWGEEQAAVAGKTTEKTAAERHEILASAEFAAKEPAAIERLLRLAFAAQFADPADAAKLELYVPGDYMDRSRRFGALRGALESFDLHPSLAGVTVPTLLLYGELEPGATVGGPALDRALPGSKLVILSGAGHFPMIERPEAFVEAVEAFLDGLPADQALLTRPTRKSSTIAPTKAVTSEPTRPPAEMPSSPNR